MTIVKLYAKIKNIDKYNLEGFTIMLPFMPAARAKTVFDIPYQDIFQIGFKGIIFDIDQTLVMHGAPITKEIYDLLQKLKQIGFRLFFLSNNSKERIVEFNQDLSIPFIPLSEKPNPKNFIKALEMMDLEPFETVMIGDQLFTDVLGASRANIPTILVDFLYDPKKGGIGKKRWVEKLILTTYPLLRQKNKSLDRVKKESHHGFLE